MLDPGGDDVIALVAQCKEHALERKIVGLAAAAGEDDFIILAAEQSRDLAARLFDRGFRRGGRPMPARRIAEMILKKRLHRGGDRRIDRRARVVVEIDALAWSCRRDPARCGGSCATLIGCLDRRLD